MQSRAGSHQKQVLRNLLNLSFPPGKLGRGSDTYIARDNKLRYSISQNTVCCIVCVVLGNERGGNYQSGMSLPPLKALEAGQNSRAY